MNGVPSRGASLLGFDYGSRRIGVAVGDTISRTATPLRIVRVRDGRPDWPAISAIIDEWRPATLVVGLPLNMDGTEQAVTGQARRFGRQLDGRYRLPVAFIDERLSSVEARGRLQGAATGPETLDSIAAQVILETWLGQQ